MFGNVLFMFMFELCIIKLVICIHIVLLCRDAYPHSFAAADAHLPEVPSALFPDSVEERSANISVDVFRALLIWKIFFIQESYFFALLRASHIHISYYNKKTWIDF